MPASLAHTSYAAALKASPGPPPPPRPASGPRPRPVIGIPKVSLPFSQLDLGRTSPPWYAGGWRTDDTCEILADTADTDGSVLRVRYPAGSGSPRSKGPPGGAGFVATPRCLPATDAILEYSVKFAPNFEWSYGGKLPGLFIGKGVAAGGERSAGAASCRLMWQREGGLVAYVYTPAGARQSAAFDREAGGRSSTGYGHCLFAAARLQLRGRGQWNKVVMRVKLNGFDDSNRPKQDGVLTIGVNGKAATMSGIVWRRFPDVKITHVMFSTFFGGAWTSPVSTHADFAGFSIVA